MKKTEQFRSGLQKGILSIIPALLAIMLTHCAGPATGAKDLANDHHVFSGRHLSQWIDLTAKSAQAPPAAEDAALVYDSHRHRMILFGGKNDADENMNETWAFSFETHTWEKLPVKGEIPPPSEDHVCIYDPENDQLILHGGEDGDTRNILYRLDLKQLQWSDLTDSLSPWLENHTAIYNSVMKSMIVFGGETDGISNNEVWALNLNAHSSDYLKWRLLPRGKKAPRPRSHHVAVFDRLQNRMIIFGGWEKHKKKLLDDTWAYYFDNQKWEKIRTKWSSPPKRKHAVGVYYPPLHWFMLQGGFGDKGYLNDVWAFDMNHDRWLNITPGPQPRFDHQAVFDPDSGELVIYGGDARLPEKFHDVWGLRMGEIQLQALLKAAGKKQKKKRR